MQRLYNDDNGIQMMLTDDCRSRWYDYSITEFYLYDANDVIIKAAPLPGSIFRNLLKTSLNLNLELCAFEKMNSTLMYYVSFQMYYDFFGFFWFEITEITVREMCFFGDICIDWFWLPMVNVHYGDGMVCMDNLHNVSRSDTRYSS